MPDMARVKTRVRLACAGVRGVNGCNIAGTVAFPVAALST